jgi:ribose 1,5-bisphosphokinase
MSGSVPGRERGIGPGRLILVVGPSGAGKDTLIAQARAHAAAGSRDDATIVFPRRVVTRPASPFEDHDCILPPAFDAAVAAGAFALWWSAHGLNYGIPVAIDADIAAGRTVACNVSRTIVGMARERYARVTVALITAPPDVLAARLAARDRGSDGRAADRLSRGAALAGDVNPDIIIENVEAPQVGGQRLLDVIQGRSLVLNVGPAPAH